LTMATQKLNLTRDQLATFLKSHEQIKQFERLFQIADEVAPASDTTGISIQAGTAQSTANDALAQLQRIGDLLALIASAPATENNNSVATDYIDLSESPAPVDKTRRLSWNSGDGTLDIGMGYDGVVQQVGLETYYRIKASADISDGDCVMFTGSVGASGVLKGAPSATNLASGQLIMGVATMDIANNDFGYVTAFGLVRGIDTSAFSDGDILYYDPSTVGGLTNVEPAPTQPRVIVAAVVNAGPGGSGSVFVRPTFIPKANTLPYTTKTADYTVTEGDGTIFCDATSGAITITLLPAATLNGHTLNIKKIDSSANAVTIAADGSETIDGSSTVINTIQWANIAIQSDGSNWYIL